MTGTCDRDLGGDVRHSSQRYGAPVPGPRQGSAGRWELRREGADSPASQAAQVPRDVAPLQPSGGDRAVPP